MRQKLWVWRWQLRRWWWRWTWLHIVQPVSRFYVAHMANMVFEGKLLEEDIHPYLEPIIEEVLDRYDGVNRHIR